VGSCCSLSRVKFSTRSSLRMKDTVDTLLQGLQAGFRRIGSCTDQIATLRIIVELNSLSPMLNFIDYQKAFNSVDRETLEASCTYRVLIDQDHPPA
jgi:hypothetical protein